MVEHGKRGWLWRDADRFPQNLGELERKVKNVEIQIKRFADALPDLAPEASQVGRAFTEAAVPLVALWKSRKNKFRPLSPEEAALALETAHSAEEAWRKLLARDDVRHAIQGNNRSVRAQERRSRSLIADGRRETLARLESPEFRVQLRQHVGKTLEQGLGIAVTLHGFGGDEHRAMWRRLGVVHFIRITYEESDERAAKLAAFLRQTPPPTAWEVATEAALNLLRDDVTTFDPRRPRFGAPGSRVPAYLQAAIEGFAHSMGAWAREGKTPDQVGPGYFTVLGHDFTLAARPDF